MLKLPKAPQPATPSKNTPLQPKPGLKVEALFRPETRSFRLIETCSGRPVQTGADILLDDAVFSAAGKYPKMWGRISGLPVQTIKAEKKQASKIVYQEPDGSPFAGYWTPDTPPYSPNARQVRRAMYLLLMDDAIYAFYPTN